MSRTGKFIKDVRTGEYLGNEGFTRSLDEARAGLNFAQAHRIARAHPKRKLVFVIVTEGKEEVRLPLNEES